MDAMSCTGSKLYSRVSIEIQRHFTTKKTKKTNKYHAKTVRTRIGMIFIFSLSSHDQKFVWI